MDYARSIAGARPLANCFYPTATTAHAGAVTGRLRLLESRADQIKDFLIVQTTPSTNAVNCAFDRAPT